MLYHLNPLTIYFIDRFFYPDYSTSRHKLTEVSAELAASRIDIKAELRYFVVGDGDDCPRLERLEKEQGVEQEVIFSGSAIAVAGCDADELNHFDRWALALLASVGRLRR